MRSLYAARERERNCVEKRSWSNACVSREVRLYVCIYKLGVRHGQRDEFIPPVGIVI